MGFWQSRWNPGMAGATGSQSPLLEIGKNHVNLRVIGKIFILVTRVLVNGGEYQSCIHAVGAIPGMVLR